MTANEWLVIIIAAAVFILLNIIIWTVVAAKHRHSAAPPQEQQPEAPMAEADAALPVPDDQKKNRRSNRKPAVPPDFPASAPRERIIREDFRLIDNIIIVHTNERL